MRSKRADSTGSWWRTVCRLSYDPSGVEAVFTRTQLETDQVPNTKLARQVNWRGFSRSAAISWDEQT